jgi:hypothetical protein
VNADHYTYRSEADRLVEQFYLWELKGRGIEVWGLPVPPEPLFEPFPGHSPTPLPIPEVEIPPPLLLGFFDKISDGLFGKPQKPAPPAPPPVPAPFLPHPSFFNCEEYTAVELEITLPPTQTVNREITEQLILSLGFCSRAVSFEVVGMADAIHIQFAVHPRDADQVEQQIASHFPGVRIKRHERLFADLLLDGPEEPRGTFCDLRLANEFMRPLTMARNFTADPLVGITGALAGLREREVGILQVLFQPTQHPWAESMLRAVTWEDGSPFLDAALLAQTREKTSRPLFAVVVRILTRSNEPRRAEDIARGLRAALAPISDPSANVLVPLQNLELEYLEVCLDTIRRRTRHSGMILNSEELVSFVHPPSPSVQTPKLRRQMGKTKAAPAIASGHRLVLGINEDAGKENEVTLSPEQRVRHMHVIGASGTGKSTFLFNLILQDIHDGEGLALLDPHGDLVDAVLAQIPSERIQDVVLVDPADAEYPVGFNILSAHSELEKTLLASDLVSVFQRLSTSWGDQMNSVFANAILAFLESDRGGTIADLRRFLVEKEFRTEFLATVTDPEVVYYWTKQYPLLKGTPQAPLLTRLDTFLRPKPIRYMVSQKVNRINFAEIMDSGKIFLAKLAQGAIGEENAYLLGTLLVSKFHQLAIGRQQVSEAKRRDFWCYIDECHHFVTPSMASILTGARKYRLGLILAHQELAQFQRNSEVAGALLANPYTRICFRVGDEDARRLSGGFSFFEPNDLQNLGTGEAIGRIERSDFDFNLTVPFREPPDARLAEARKQEVITASRKKYGTPRAQVEALLRTKAERDEPPLPKAAEAPQRAEVSKPTPSPYAASVPTPVPEPAVTPAKTLASESKPPPDKGIGGNQHNLIRERIEMVARQLGYTASREHPAGGNQKVDVVLEKANRAIACEIAITTTVDHEVGNVAKCLKAGYRQVAVISHSEDRLEKIKQAVAACLSTADAARVSFYTPEQFIAHLQELAIHDAALAAAPRQSETRRGKYKVNSTEIHLTAEERKQRETAAMKLLAVMMQKQK